MIHCIQFYWSILYYTFQYYSINFLVIINYLIELINIISFQSFDSIELTKMIKFNTILNNNQ